MKYLETKHERNSAKITALIVAILILLLFVVGPPYLDPPEEYGVAVNFGNSPVGTGNIQPTKPIKSQPTEEVVKEETKAQPTETSKATNKAEDVITNESPESIAIKKAKEAEAKAKAEAERQEAIKKAEAAAKAKAEQEAKDKLDALIGGVKNSEGTETGGEGPGDGPGDKGQLDGDPYAPSYFGPGNGGGGKGYGLNGRGTATYSKVLPDCQEEGRVVVEIHVNRSGNVVKAIPGKRGTTGGSCLYEAARKTALTHKWPADSNAPTTQIGWVKIDFSLGN
ncbi:energy transducer TonB [Psychroserpens sp. SPM9]|uniref:energy transducer TonB n=1 Tax=Psychroserpens sp. SPM9 TaxID=2975598 RepID=UPI0021A55DC3|nr:energy transducer TonB [Psychroserpens sp. SPM9]MDG5492312.1 energy transducer TonB [Psychroserpens sp. SPM9]